jgi:hypothetical protein
MRIRLHVGMAGLAVAGLVAAPLAAAAEDGAVFAVTVTNLTLAQPLSPPVVAAHAPGLRLFAAGEAASPELALIAEDAVNGPMVARLSADRRVGDVAVGAGPIPPGGSATIRIRAGGAFRRLSLASMLVNTNDAFTGLSGVDLPAREATLAVPAYDAGSEANNEDCGFIPGPACGMAGVRDTAGAEGFVHVHRGIHGVGDLPPATYDWRNPVARVTVTRVRGGD